MKTKPTFTLNMTVDVRLCGSIPRQDIEKGGSARITTSCLTSQANRLNTPYLAATNGCQNDSSTHRTIGACNSLESLILHSAPKSTMRDILQEKQLHPLAQVFDPPAWAVPARGETRLEPVCDAVGRQRAVDLTKRLSYRIGRSPHSDVQLIHATSSRRHAMIFHHTNGSCYIVDCGSAHGTFVNGVRIAPPHNGVVVPHKVRRGALIRFGGVGAPSFVLKSFSFTLHDLTTSKSKHPDSIEVLRRNTRVNALGRCGAERVRQCIDDVLIDGLSISRKRSSDSLDSGVTETDEPSTKRMRCTSPPLSLEQSSPSLVSPDHSLSSKRRRVTFSLEPPESFYPACVTPDVLSSEEEYDSN